VERHYQAKVVSQRACCRINRQHQPVAWRPFRKSNLWPLNEADATLDLVVTVAVAITKPIPAGLTAPCVRMAL